tara:strand:- start:82187 stop:84475 length:2289 start_codon:yes stop_codon:yes gene_type:complete
MADSSWFYHSGGSPTGPVSFAEIERLILANQLGPEDLVIQEGDLKWVPASEHPELLKLYSDGEVDSKSLDRGVLWVVLKTDPDDFNKTKQLGPFNEQEVKAKIQSGEISYQDHIWEDGSPTWKKVAEIEQFSGVEGVIETASVAPDEKKPPVPEAHEEDVIQVPPREKVLKEEIPSDAKPLVIDTPSNEKTEINFKLDASEESPFADDETTVVEEVGLEKSDLERNIDMEATAPEIPVVKIKKPPLPIVAKPNPPTHAEASLTSEDPKEDEDKKSGFEGDDSVTRANVVIKDLMEADTKESVEVEKAQEVSEEEQENVKAPSLLEQVEETVGNIVDNDVSVVQPMPESTLSQLSQVLDYEAVDNNSSEVDKDSVKLSPEEEASLADTKTGVIDEELVGIESETKDKKFALKKNLSNIGENAAAGLSSFKEAMKKKRDASTHPHGSSYRIQEYLGYAIFILALVILGAVIKKKFFDANTELNTAKKETEVRIIPDNKALKDKQKLEAEVAKKKRELELELERKQIRQEAEALTREATFIKAIVSKEKSGNVVMNVRTDAGSQVKLGVEVTSGLRENELARSYFVKKWISTKKPGEYLLDLKWFSLPTGKFKVRIYSGKTETVKNIFIGKSDRSYRKQLAKNIKGNSYAYTSEKRRLFAFMRGLEKIYLEMRASSSSRTNWRSRYPTWRKSLRSLKTKDMNVAANDGPNRVYFVDAWSSYRDFYSKLEFEMNRNQKLARQSKSLSLSKEVPQLLSDLKASYSKI